MDTEKPVTSDDPALDGNSAPHRDPEDSTILVDLWTDLVCPWCYLGEARLHDAIEAEGLAGRVHLRLHSFELDPTAPVSEARSNIAHLVQAKGMAEDEVRAMEEQIQQLAGELGRDYALERPMASTRAVHRVMHAVRAAAADDTGGEQAAAAFFLGLQRAYFAGRVNPFDAEQVIARAVETGLAPEAARAAWEGTTNVGTASEGTSGVGTASENAVADDVALAREIGVRGVPFFVFDETYSAPGAIPLDAFRQVLRSLADGTQP